MSISLKQQVEEILKEQEAVLVRQKKHKVYRFPDGRMFTIPKTPSDNRGWDNCLQVLKRMTQPAPVAKTQTDFEHHQKEPYVKAVPQRKEFLADLPEREVRPKTPVSESPLALLKKKLQKEKDDALLAELERKQKSEEREVFDIGGKIPMAAGGKGGRRWSGYHRHGTVTTYSQAKIAEMNLGLASIGDILKAKEEKGDNKMVSEKEAVVKGGSLEAALENAREEMNKHKASAEAHQMEFLRYGKIVEALEQTVRLATASRASLKDMFSSGGEKNGAGRASTSRKDMKPKGFWREKFKEILVTTPISLNMQTLVSDVCKSFPDATRGSIQQVMYQGLKHGWIVKDNQGFLKYKEV